MKENTQMRNLFNAFFAKKLLDKKAISLIIKDSILVKCLIVAMNVNNLLNQVLIYLVIKKQKYI